jgi:hypothetical protein
MLSIPVLLGLLPSCGNDSPCGCQEDTEALVFRRGDGSAISFAPDTQTYVWCGDWEPGSVSEPALHILVASSVADTPYWNLRLVLADATVGDTLFIPNQFVWNLPDSLDFYLFDPPNEVSSQQIESSGFLVLQQLGCDPGQTVEFNIDAVLASEIAEQPPVKVQGRFLGSINGAPPSKEAAGTPAW